MKRGKSSFSLTEGIAEISRHISAVLPWRCLFLHSYAGTNPLTATRFQKSYQFNGSIIFIDPLVKCVIIRSKMIS